MRISYWSSDVCSSDLPRDVVAVENPGYRAAGHAFAVAGADVRGVPVDGDGLDCAALGALSHCRLAYVTPSHQYPTGVVMSLPRRLELLAWADRNDGWILEDGSACSSQ